MPKLLCLDPHDPYAQREVLVEFERIGTGFLLVAALDDHHDDILPDLVDAQRDDLLREIVDADRLDRGLCPVPSPLRPDRATDRSASLARI